MGVGGEISARSAAVSSEGLWARAKGSSWSARSIGSTVRSARCAASSVNQEPTTGPKRPSRTLLVITYDEWGGFFDHVPPPVRPPAPADQALGNDGRLGFRIPTIVISPQARKKHVASAELDHSSILKLIEWRWSLAPLTNRDAEAANLAEILGFGRAQPRAPRYRVKDAGFPTLCPPTGIDKWQVLLDLALGMGWR